MSAPLTLIMKFVLIFWVLAASTVLTLFAWEMTKDFLAWRRLRKAERARANVHRALYADNLKKYP